METLENERQWANWSTRFKDSIMARGHHAARCALDAMEQLAEKDAGSLCVRPMFLTLGLALIRGVYHGLVSRVSANAVTNVAREGFGQGVFVGVG